MSTLLTAAQVVEDGLVSVRGFDKYLQLLSRRPECGLSRVLRAYYYGPYAAMQGVTAPPVSHRFINALSPPDNCCFGPCYFCAKSGRDGKRYSVVFTEPVPAAYSVMLACNLCDWVGPMTNGDVALRVAHDEAKGKAE